MDSIKHKVRHFILTRYLPGEPAENLQDDTPLQTSGILDSLAALELVAFLEQEFEIELTMGDTSVERFDRLSDIAALVAQKRLARQRRAS